VNQMACADLDFSLTPEQQAEIESCKTSTHDVQEEIIKKGNTGSVPKNLLMPPVPTMPVFFKADASNGQPASTSALLMDQLKLFSTWFAFAPMVEALEL
jgi:hypothetical protein